MKRAAAICSILFLALTDLSRGHGTVLPAAFMVRTEDASREGYVRSHVFGAIPDVSNRQLSQMPGWPKTMGVYPNLAPSGCVLADVDGDADLEVLAGSTDGSFHLWYYEGNELPGWPKTGLGAIQTEAAVGDIDGDGDLEIAVPDRTGNLYIWNHDGTDLSGWPQSVDETGGLKAAVLFDLDEDGSLEIILGQRLWPRGRVQIFQADGAAFPGWPQYLDYMCVATPSVADVDGDDVYEICAASYYSVYLWDQSGNPEPGWPIANYYTGASYAQPTLCDLDGDSDLEILVMYYASSQDYVSVFHGDGTVFPGWPQTYPGPQGFVCPVMGDIDGDEDFEIFGGGHVFGGPDFSSRHHDGIQVAGWPVAVGMVECSPLIFDLDGDGDREILVGSNTNPGELYAFQGDGSTVAGWPVSMTAAAGVNSATVGDVDLDGDLEIALVNSDGTVNLWTLDGVPCRGYYTDWGSYFHDLWNTGWFHPVAPTGLSASALPSGLVRLNWNPNPEPDVAGYNLYRSELSGGPYDRVNANLVLDTVYSDTTVSPTTTYFYVATCIIKAQAESRLSDEVSVTTGVEESVNYQLSMTNDQLLQIYPNPFRQATVILYSLPRRCGDGGTRGGGDVSTSERISLSVYDLSGRLVRTLLERPSNYPTVQLSNQVVWDGRDAEGADLPSGIYHLTLSFGDVESTAKVILLR